MSYMIDRMEDFRESNPAVETPLQCVGYEVRDVRGQKIGRVQEIYTNERGEPEYVRTKLGPAGMGRSVMIPVAAVEVDDAFRTLVLQ